MKKEENLQDELYGGAPNALEAAEEYLENARKHLRDVMKPAEKAAKELETATATEKARLQGTKETKAPALKPYTEAIDVRSRNELGRLIESAKAEKRDWKVKRCSSEAASKGYRYTFYTNKLPEIFTESLNRKPLKEAEEDTLEMPTEVQAEEEPKEETELEVTEVTTEEPVLETFEQQMDFLMADEDEAIAGYEKVLGLVEDEHVKEQLEKILVEERAHRDFLSAVKEDQSLEYSHEEHEEETEEEPEGELELPEEPSAADEMVEIDLGEIEEEPIEEDLEGKKFIKTRNSCVDAQDLADALEASEIAYEFADDGLMVAEKDFETATNILLQLEMECDESLKTEDLGYDDGSLSEEKEILNETAKISLDDLKLFKPWGGAKDTWELILAQDKLEALDKALEDMYPEGLTASDLNDILWFEKDWIVEKTGLDVSGFVKDPNAIEVEAEVIEEPAEEETENA